MEESARLVRVEQSLAALWERVEAGGRQMEQRHMEVLRLYTDLQRQQLASAHSSEEEPWLSGLLDHQVSQLRRRLDEERLQREQVRSWTHQYAEMRVRSETGNIRNITQCI